MVIEQVMAYQLKKAVGELSIPRTDDPGHQRAVVVIRGTERQGVLESEIAGSAASVVVCGAWSSLSRLDVYLPSCLERVTYDFRHCVSVDSVLPTVTRLHPIGEILCALARIARGATSGDILTGDDGCIVDDVFPRCDSLPGTVYRHLLDHLEAAVDAGRVSLPHFLFPLRPS